MFQATEFGLRIRSADGDVEVHPASSHADAVIQASYMDPERLITAEVVQRQVGRWEAVGS